VSNDVTNPAYDVAIGSLAYSKGDAIIRMAEGFISKDVFNQGLNNYLTDNA
jgi:aminopeptidase N